MEFSWDIIGIYYGMNEHIYTYIYIVYIYSVYGILYKNQLDMFLGVQLKIGGTIKCFFPTCQVRVVRFYQSCSPPPPPPPPSPPRPPPRSPDDPN